MLSFIRLDCGQGGDVLFHGNVLSHQPALIDLQKSRKKMGDIGTRHGFAAHVLTHMTFAKFDIELLSRMHKVNLFENDSAILVLSVQFSSSASSNPNTNQLTKLRKFNIKCNYFASFCDKSSIHEVQLM